MLVLLMLVVGAATVGMPAAVMGALSTLETLRTLAGVVRPVLEAE